MANIIEIEGKKYKLVPIKEKKPEKETYAVFMLTMPAVGSWNGKWTGAGEFYAVTKKILERGKQLYPNLRQGNYSYDFGDGWRANINVEFVTPSKAKEIEKKAKGFMNYEWMIASILKHGKICEMD